MNSFTINQGDTQPVLTGIVLLNPDGTPVDLSSASVKFIYRLEGASEWTERTATIEDAATGQVGYSWVAADTAVAGDYYFAFEVTYSGGEVETFPNGDEYYEFSIIGQLDSTDAYTPYSKFYRAIRSILGDNDPDIHIYEDDTIKDMLQFVLNLGKVEGYSATRTGITPALSIADDTQAYARLIWHTARYFSANITSSAFTTRAFSERLGEPKALIDLVMDEVYRLEMGAMAE